MENLKSYLDGELDIAQQAEVETHLRNDAELQKTVEEFSAISSTLKTADSGEPYGFEKLEAKLAEKPKASVYEKKKIWRLATNWSASMACLALAVMFVRSGSGSSADATMSSSLSSEAKTAATGSPSLTVDGSMAKQSESNQDSAKGDFARTRSGVSIGRTSAESEIGGGGGGKDAFSDKVKAQADPPQESAPSSGSKSGGSNDVFGSDPKSLSDVPMSGSPAKGSNKPFVEERGRGGFSGDSGLSDPSKKSMEGSFKANMRSIRDKTSQPVTTLGDTPHGIYLERAGQVQVKVDDLMRAVNETTGMIQSFHGFVTASDLQNQADGGIATMTLRVPTENFNSTLDKLQSMGEVLNVTSNSQDITSETVDQGARMVSWADEEKRLIDELNKAKENYRKVQIRAELRNVRANLESYRASVKSLTERAKFSTINVSFVRGDKAVKAGGTGNWSGDALKGAKDNLSGIGQVVGTMGIYFLVFAPIWLPFAIAAYIIRKKNS